MTKNPEQIIHQAIQFGIPKSNKQIKIVPKESQKESEEVKETTNVKKTEAKQSLDNDAVWMPLFTRDGLENTPKSILFDIATELAEFGEIAGESPLAKRKRLVLMKRSKK